jgi:hypothetical protein
METTAIIRRLQPEGDQAGSLEMKALPIVGPSGSTKSWGMRIITRELLRSRANPNDVPALRVTLADTVTGTKALHLAILEAFGDPGREAIDSSSYKPYRATMAIKTIASQLNTHIVVLDEAHNMLARTTPERAAVALKSLVNAGLFSLVVCGTEDVLPIFSAGTEFKSRLFTPVDFSPPLIADVEGCQELFSFAQKLCDEALRSGILDLPFDIVDTVEHCALLYDMTGGVIGQVANHLQRGVAAAFERGVPFVTWDNMIEAYNSWYRVAGGSSPNPIESGVKPSTIKAVQKLVSNYGHN